MFDLIRNPAFWTATALVAPLAINLDPTAESEAPRGIQSNRSESSPTVTFTVGGGAGTHGTGVELLLGTISEGGGYGCAGETPGTTYEVKTTLDFEESFVDAGGELDLKPGKEPFHMGVRGGYIWEQATFVGDLPVNPLTGEIVEVPSGVELTTQYGYINPYVAIESENIGIGLGAVFSEQPLRSDDVRGYPLDTDRTTQPSFHVRFGSLTKIYFNYSLWENVPIYSGGGKHNVGMGLQLGKHVGVWGGVSSGGPYRTDAVLFRATLGSSHAAAVNITTRVPIEYKGHDGVTLIEEGSLSMSLRFRFGGDG